MPSTHRLHLVALKCQEMAENCKYLLPHTCQQVNETHTRLAGWWGLVLRSTDLALCSCVSGRIGHVRKAGGPFPSGTAVDPCQPLSPSCLPTSAVLHPHPHATLLPAPGPTSSLSLRVLPGTHHMGRCSADTWHRLPTGGQGQNWKSALFARLTQTPALSKENRLSPRSGSGPVCSTSRGSTDRLRATLTPSRCLFGRHTAMSSVAPSNSPHTPKAFLNVCLARWEDEVPRHRLMDRPACVWPKIKGPGTELDRAFWEWIHCSFQLDHAFSPTSFLVVLGVLLAFVDKQLVGSIFPGGPSVTTCRAAPGTSQRAPSSYSWLNSLCYLYTNALPRTCLHIFQ